MIRRKQVIIDKKFQFKITFSIIGMVTIVAALIVAGMAASLVYNNHRIEKINAMEDRIVQYLQVKSITEKSTEPDKKAMKEIAVNHSNNMAAMESLVRSNKILLAVLVVFVICQCGILYLMLIKKTHQIAGPVFVMSRYIQDIIKGEYPVTRKIRKKDELQEFYAQFCNMMDVLRERGRK
jgi:nitrogen fixation/metabolism regulation signal transduction histidine kinase